MKAVSTIRYMIKNKLGQYVSKKDEWEYTDNILKAAVYRTKKKATQDLAMPGEKVQRIRYILIEEKE